MNEQAKPGWVSKVKTVLAFVFFPITLLALLLFFVPRAVADAINRGVRARGDSQRVRRDADRIADKLGDAQRIGHDTAAEHRQLERTVAASRVELANLEDAIGESGDELAQLEQRNEHAAEVTRRSIDIVTSLLTKSRGDGDREPAADD